MKFCAVYLLYRKQLLPYPPEEQAAVEASDLTQKKAEVDLSANKIMPTVYSDSCGVIGIDYLQKGRTITRRIL